MKRIIGPILLSAALAAGAFGQATVMVDTNTGLLRSPTNFFTTNAVILRAEFANEVAAIRLDITNVNARIVDPAAFSPVLGTGALSRVTADSLTVTGITNPATGVYWDTGLTTNEEAIFRNTNGYYNFLNDTLDYVVSTNLNTNGPCWTSYFFRETDYEPINGAAGTATVAIAQNLPGGQIGIGTNDAPGVLQWLGQPIADGTVGIHIGGQWITNSTALVDLIATNGVLLWRGIPLADSNGMSFVGGSLWTNSLSLTNISFVTSVTTNGSGEIQATTGTLSNVVIVQ